MTESIRNFVSMLAIVGVGTAAALLVWGIGTWGRPSTPVFSRQRKHERYIRMEEPLLPQLWRFLRVLASGQTVNAAFGSLFDSAKIETLLSEARYPWGLRASSDVYAIGIPLGVVSCLALLYLTGQWYIILAVPMFLGLGIFAPVSALKLIARGTRQAETQELWLLLTGMNIYLGAKYTLFDALKESSGACVLIREPIEQCLLEWGSVGAETALDNLGRTLQIPEAYIVISALRQAADVDPANLQTFMLMAAHQIDKSLEAYQARSRQIKPLLQSATLMVPMFNVFALWTFPLAYNIVARMNQVGF